MNRPDLMQTFQRMASEIAEKDFSHVTEDAKIAALGIDSLGMLELVGQMERELGVQIPDEQLVGIQTVRQLLDLVEKRVTPLAGSGQ
ncbi:MAG: acyl carrier protein [Myxococcota bacterium]|nr:acyl carrier protein [Myxococcota bacterium]